MLQGLMMQMPLLISSLIEHADRHHADVEIVSRRVEGDVHRTTYRGLHARARQMANALAGLGIARAIASQRSAGTGTGTWSCTSPCQVPAAYCIRSIRDCIHEQIAWIVNHAEDCALFFDLTFLPLVEAIAPHCTTVRRWVLMTDRAHMPAEKIGARSAI